MVTARFRWLIVLGAVGAGMGLLRGRETAALISLALLAWLFGEWLLFRLRCLELLRSATVTRWVNGDSGTTGTLWSGRTTRIHLTLTVRSWLGVRIARLEDLAPQILELVEGSAHSDGPLGRGCPLELDYAVRPRAAGRAALPGVSVAMFDLQGLFYTQLFLPCDQQWQILPMPVPAEGPQPRLKLRSSLPPPGIHRFQSPGIGFELLELREYTPGDPPKSIAWKASARRDRLLIRQNESEVPIRTTLFVDHSAPTRWGAFGTRPLDLMTELAATVAQSSLSVRDPVGLVLFDEHAARTVRAGGGERHFFRLLGELATTASQPPEPPARFTLDLLDHAWYVAKQRDYGPLRRDVNRVPFFYFPLTPVRRSDAVKRRQLSVLLATRYQLPVTETVAMLRDNSRLARWLNRYLWDSGWPIPETDDAGLRRQRLKLKQLTDSLLNAVARGHDNEVFVIFADLLDCAELGTLPKAIQLATARHHRVVVICPWPDRRRPDDVMGRALAAQILPENATPEQLVYQAERIRLARGAEKLRRDLRRARASVAFTSEPQATQLVLAQAELVRTGRTTRI